MPSGFSVTPEQKLELLEYWRSVLKRKWAILGLGMVVALVAAIFAYSLTPVYRSTATVLIEPGKVKVVSIEDVYTSNQLQGIQTQTEILKSREIAERTARALETVGASGVRSSPGQTRLAHPVFWACWVFLRHRLRRGQRRHWKTPPSVR